MKTCKCGCGWPVFSHGYAKFCQNKRTDDKKPKSLRIKVTQVKDFSKTPDFGFQNQQDMFMALWDNAKDDRGDVFCKYTGEKLNRFYRTDLFWSCFAHILPKGRFPYFKLNPDNIRVVYPLFHTIVDQGTYDQRKQYPEWKFDEWDADKIRMQLEYTKFKAQNLLS